MFGSGVEKGEELYGIVSKVGYMYMYGYVALAYIIIRHLSS